MRDWVTLNRARSKVARTGDNLLRWGKALSAACPCGKDPQTLQHLQQSCKLAPPCMDFDLREANSAARTWIQEWSDMMMIFPLSKESASLLKEGADILVEYQYN